MFTFAHLSDVHLPPLPPVPARRLWGKRGLGYVSWHRRRKHEHPPAVVRALTRDLAHQRPDHVCVTGDLTNLGLPDEFARAADWLRALGPADRVSVVPGNHDAYARGSLGGAARAWAAWTTGDDGEPYPWVRRRAGLAFVGVSTAVPTPPLSARGRLGRAQLERLRGCLLRCRRAGLVRILLIHHPPQPAAVARRRALADAAALRSLLAQVGCELVLHGHAHQPLDAELAGPSGPIPVRGVGSASLAQARDGRVGHYRVYRYQDDGRLLAHDRWYDAATRAFVPGITAPVALGGRAGPGADGCVKPGFV